MATKHASFLEVFAAFDSLASALNMGTALAQEPGWQLRAYADGCAAVAHAAGWSMDELCTLRYDAYLARARQAHPTDRLTITVAGGPGVGKTSMALELHDHLRGFGFTHVTVHDPDVTESRTVPAATEVRGRVRAVAGRGTRVAIVTVQTAKPTV